MKKNNRVLKRLLSGIISIVLIISGASYSVFAEDTPASVTVNFTTQAMNGFLCAPQYGIEVSGDLSTKYGFDDEKLDDNKGVSCLDVMLRAHEIVFGEDFTADTVSDYIDGNASYIMRAFGGFYGWSFAVNGLCPNDGVWNDVYGAYTGYSIDEVQVKDGDFVELFSYQDDELWSDSYSWFMQDETRADEIKGIYPAKDISFTLVGYSYCYYGCTDEETLGMVTKPIENAQLGFVNISTGEITDIAGATTDEEGQFVLKAPTQAGEYYLTAYSKDEDSPVVMPLLKIGVTEPSNAKIIVPSDSTLTLGRKDFTGYNYKPFTSVNPIYTIVDDVNKTATYYYNLTNGKEHYYRVSGEDYITYAGYFSYKSTTGVSVSVSDEMLKPDGKTKDTTDHDVASNGGYNVADIYLNINEKGYLKLDNIGDKYQIIHLRNWEAINTTTGNIFVEPDYSFTVIDESGDEDNSVVTVSDSGVLNAVGNGTAIVLVTYDAMSYAQSMTAAGNFYGAIWPENTGVFVVSVGEGESGIETGMTLNAGRNPVDTAVGKLSGDAIDSELDVIYYTGNAGEYTFSPKTGGVAVSVANPVLGDKMTFDGFKSVSKNNGGSFSVPLTEGRNIVKIEKNGKAEYQVITAKRVNISGIPEYAVPGQEISILFDTVYHPANKLAGVYNMSACISYLTPNGELAGGTSNQYRFAADSSAQCLNNIIEKQTKGWMTSYAKKATLKIPEDWSEDTFTLSNGSIISLGFGDPYGNHRGITLEDGKAPNLNANIKEAFLGSLPDIVIPVIPLEVERIEIINAPDKTEYYEGDIFDATGMSVKAYYVDGTSAEVLNYTVDERPIKADDTHTVVKYGSKTADVDINVIPLKVTSLKIKKAPDKLKYHEGEYFDASGMEVEVTYNSGRSEITNNYQYTPSRQLSKGDTEITVFSGDLSDKVEIIVEQNTGGGGGSANNTITVKFSLLGDKEHKSDECHTLKSNNLETWISKTSFNLPKNSHVVDLIVLALKQNGIPYTNDSGNYIDSVKGLAEFSNGQLSGWMYTINGVHPSLGIGEQKLENGDVVVFHYTDDYTKEQDSNKWSSRGSTSSVKKGITIHFETNTDEKINDVTINMGEKVKMPTIKNKDGFSFCGWYTDKDFSEKFNFDTKLQDNKTLYAKWIKNEEETIVFDDVKKGAWYEDAVICCAKRKLLCGVSQSRFNPFESMTREMMTTVLWRLDNMPDALDKASFTDVEKGAWYYDAVLWASSRKIVYGYSSEIFGIGDKISREQMLTMLYRYYGIDEISECDLSSFADADSISEYAVNSVKWAVSSGLILGDEKGCLNPKGTLNRAEAAEIIKRVSDLKEEVQ